MTPNEITTVIASDFNKMFDDPFKLMLMKKVDAYRGRFIKNSLDKEPKDRKFFRQTIYIPMTQGKEIDCDLGVELCDVVVSPILPNVLRANSILFDYVGAINGANPFQEVQPGMISFMNSSRYSGHIKKFAWVNSRLVVFTKSLPMARIDAIFDNPSEVADFVCSGEGNCNYWDLPYPCTNDIMQLILQYLVADMKSKPEELSIPLNTQTDKIQ